MKNDLCKLLLFSLSISFAIDYVSPALRDIEKTVDKNKKVERIAISELKKDLENLEEFLLIDVREDSEIKQHGAIPGAIHIPMSELDKRMKTIPKNIRVVFYWMVGGRAARAAEKFIKCGYDTGQFCGILDWKKAGEQVVETVDSPEPRSIQPNLGNNSNPTFPEK